jgi:hypothetical protein
MIRRWQAVTRIRMYFESGANRFANALGGNARKKQESKMTPKLWLEKLKA